MEENNAKRSNSESIGKNLRPFDLEAAKAGKPVCTRDGRKARIVCFDATNKANLPFIVLIEDNGCEDIFFYGEDGKCNRGDEYDLMMLPEKKEGWVNIFNHDNNVSWAENEIYPSEERAKNAALKIDGNMLKYIATVKIEWVE